MKLIEDLRRDIVEAVEFAMKLVLTEDPFLEAR